MNEGKPAGQRQERVQRRPVPGREARRSRSLDGEDRAATMRYEGEKGNLKPWEKPESETAGW